MTNISKLQDKNGYIKIAAMDHRDSLKKYIPADRLADFKTLLTKTFADTSTAILVDPEYGAGAIAQAKMANIGILLSREKSGYTDDNDSRGLELYDEKYNSANLKAMGANAIKILIYYNANAKNFVQKLEILKQLKAETDAAELPLLIEPIVYELAGQKLDKAQTIVDAATKMVDYADILKVEFPAEITDLKAAVPYLTQIHQLNKPWIILSRGMEFESFKEACKIAKENGACGYAVGRAVWQEVAEYKNWSDIENYIKTTAKDRMEELSKIY